MEQQRPLEYTIKIYGEGFTEWFYFDGLRTNNRFRFSMVPDVPKNSRSSYKQNLKLIEKELKKKPQERADVLFLVIDTDTLVKNKEQYSIYLATKDKYKKQGVIFIESHPCIELWFLYHLISKFARTNYETYEALRPSVEAVLPGYEKTAKYYQKNKFFKENILLNTTNRTQAINYSVRACKYEPVEQEIANYTELFKAIHFFRLLQKFAEIRTLLFESLRRSVPLQHEIEDHKSLKLHWKEEGKDIVCCTLKYSGANLQCIFPDGMNYCIDDTLPLPAQNEIVEHIITSGSLSIHKP